MPMQPGCFRAVKLQYYAHRSTTAIKDMGTVFSVQMMPAMLQTGIRQDMSGMGERACFPPRPSA